MLFLRLFSLPFPNLYSSVFNYYRQKKCNLRNFRIILFPFYSHTTLNIPDLSWTTIFKPKLILQLLDNHVSFLKSANNHPYWRRLLGLLFIWNVCFSSYLQAARCLPALLEATLHYPPLYNHTLLETANVKHSWYLQIYKLTFFCL